jgi:hypothetical protein
MLRQFAFEEKKNNLDWNNTVVKIGLSGMYARRQMKRALFRVFPSQWQPWLPSRTSGARANFSLCTFRLRVKWLHHTIYDNLMKHDYASDCNRILGKLFEVSKFQMKSNELPSVAANVSWHVIKCADHWCTRAVQYMFTLHVYQWPTYVTDW